MRRLLRNIWQLCAATVQYLCELYVCALRSPIWQYLCELCVCADIVQSYLAIFVQGGYKSESHPLSLHPTVHYGQPSQYNMGNA